MGQFNVYRNPGRTRDAIPFVLDVQSDRWEGRPDRVVVPLVLASEVGYRDRALNPEFTVGGVAVIMNPLQIVTIPSRVLGPPVDRLDRAALDIIGALDALIAQGR